MKVLVADGSALVGMHLVGLLASWGYEVVVARDGTQALAILREPDAPPIVLLGASLSGIGALDVCRAIRTDPAGSPYVLLVAPDGGTNAAGGAMDATLDALGALDHQTAPGVPRGRGLVDDVLPSPCDPRQLHARLRAARRIVDLSAELIRAREQHALETTLDPLTGLMNEAACMDALDREMMRAEREARGIAVAVIEIQAVDAVAGGLGKATADLVQLDVASRLRDAVRPYDTIARVGTNTFLILLPGVEDATARGVAERVRARVASTPVDADTPVRVTCSIGIAAAHGRAGVEATCLVTAAEAALRRARQDGRNRVQIGRLTSDALAAPLLKRGSTALPPS